MSILKEKPNYISARKQLCQFWKTSIWVPENNYADSGKLLCRFWKTTRSIMENNDVDSGKNQASRTELIYQHIKQNKINRLIPAGYWATKNAAKIPKQTGSGVRNDNNKQDRVREMIKLTSSLWPQIILRRKRERIGHGITHKEQGSKREIGHFHRWVRRHTCRHMRTHGHTHTHSHIYTHIHTDTHAYTHTHKIATVHNVDKQCVKMVHLGYIFV